MKKWEKWDEALNFQAFPQLEYLTIEHCPNLTSIPTLPFTLTELCIKDVGIVEFPKFYQGIIGSVGNEVSSLPLIPLPSSQSPHLMVNEKQVELSLKKIIITNCTYLENISLDFLRNLRVVESMDLTDCPKLLSDETGDDLLPLTMVVLNIGSCGALDVLLLGSLLHLNSLMILILEGCANITSLPGRDVFIELKALDIVVIGNCTNLASLGRIDAVQSLSELKIFGCGKLVMGSSSEPDVLTNSSKITNLIIDRGSLLLVNPLRSLSSVETLRIGHVCSPVLEQWLLQNRSSLERIEIYNASSLRYLPESIVGFTSLWRLQICKARKIESLNNLPASLEELHICGCGCTVKAQLHSSLSGNIHIPCEEDIEITEEECGDQLFPAQNHKVSIKDEESSDAEDDDTSDEEESEKHETSARVLDDNSIMLASSSSASVSM